MLFIPLLLLHCTTPWSEPEHVLIAGPVLGFRRDLRAAAFNALWTSWRE
jgi:hypothetical protein